MISPVWFFDNPANMTTMCSKRSQQLKRSRLQEKFCVAAFLIRNVCSKTFVFLNFTKKLNSSKEVENLNLKY